MAVRFATEGPIAWITLDRPQVLNAIDPETHAELLRVWERVRDSRALRVAVLTGAGPRAFCAGVDLTRLGDFYGSVPAHRRIAEWNRAPGIGGLTRNLELGKPVIAAVNGLCLGGGLELALACDLRVCSSNATFGLPELRWAIIPGQGGTQRLPRAVPQAIALEMILTGRPISARRAAEIGLVNAVVPRARLRATARTLARSIAAHSPRVVAAALTAVRRGLELPLPRALRLEQALADPLRDGPENREARAAFRQKRARRRADP